MASFVDNFRTTLGRALTPTTELQGQPRGYVPANATVKGAQQTANFSPNAALGNLVNEYNNATDWDTREDIVNAMMENYPNPDKSLASWIKNLSDKTAEGKQQSKVLNWAIKEYNSTSDLDKKEQIVNYLMETYPNPSKWLRSKIMKLDDITRQMRAYQNDIDKGVEINSMGDWK